MKNKQVIGLTLIGLAAGFILALSTSAGDLAVRAVGKAVWYLPYATLLVAVRCLVSSVR